MADKIFVAIFNPSCGCGKLRHETEVDEEHVKVFESRDDADAFIDQREAEYPDDYDYFAVVWDFDVNPAAESPGVVFVAVYNSSCGCGTLRHETVIDSNDVMVFESREEAYEFTENREDPDDYDDFRGVFECKVKERAAVKSAGKN